MNLNTKIKNYRCLTLTVEHCGGNVGDVKVIKGKKTEWGKQHENDY